MATELLSLFAKIGIDDKEYNKGIEGAESKAKTLSKGLKSAFKVGAAAVGVTAAAIGGLTKTIYSQAKATSEYGDNVDKMSQKIGISAEAYQKWDYVMQRAGGDVNSLKMGMKTLSQQAEKNSDAFQKLGISQEEVSSSSQEELLQKTIVGLSKMEASTERTTLATKLLGRAGADMGPLLNQGSEAIEEQMKIAEDYGMIMSDKAVKASADFQDSLTTLSQTATGLKNRLMGELLPGITSITDGLALMFTSDGQDEGVEKFNKGITDTLNNISTMLPKMAEIGSSIIENIATSIIDNLPELANTAFRIISDLGLYIIENLPLLLESGMTILNSIMEGLLAEDNIDTIINAITTMFTRIGEIIIENLPLLLESGIEILMALMQGIMDNLPLMIDTVITLITELVTMLTQPDMLVQLISAALDLIIALADGLVQAIPQIIAVLPTIISNIVSGIIRLAPKLLKSGVELVGKLISGIKSVFHKLTDIGKDIFGKIKDSITEKLENAKNWGKDLIDNFTKGFQEKWEKLKSKFTAVGDWIKGLFGHSTPEFGPMKNDDKWMPDMMDNFINGIDSKIPELQRSAMNAANAISGDFGSGYGYENSYGTETIKLEIGVKEGNSAMNALARAIFPYLEMTAKEKGVALA